MNPFDVFDTRAFSKHSLVAAVLLSVAALGVIVFEVAVATIVA